MTTASLLPQLEPMLAVAFALNVAYIGLPRYRYREEIRNHVKNCLSELDNLSDDLRDTDWFKQLERLSIIPDGNGENGNKANLPDETWAAKYQFWYESHFDRKIVITLAFIMAFLIVLGSAHSIGYLQTLFGYFSLTKAFGAGFVHAVFWLTVIAMLIPVCLVKKGNKVIAGAIKFSDVHTHNFKNQMQKAAQNAPVPDLENPEKPDS